MIFVKELVGLFQAFIGGSKSDFFDIEDPFCWIIGDESCLRIYDNRLPGIHQLFVFVSILDILKKVPFFEKRAFFKGCRPAVNLTKWCLSAIVLKLGQLVA